MRSPFGLATLIVGMSLAAGGTAEACGGCFHAPSPTAVQVVTDHRMVFAVSADRTILWDQFSYSGRPEEFSWILPIRDATGARVDLANPAFTQALDNLTAPRLQEPPPVPVRFCASGGFLAASAADRSGGLAGFDAGVMVLNREVIGPYERADIRGTDPNAVRDWLRNNGYFVPPSIEPVLDHYVGLRMDFVALRLRHGEGLNQMQPVRVSVPGSSPTLPLRMISAGLGEKVGLLLMVLSPGRMEAMGWPNGELSDTDLVYDYNAPSSDRGGDFLRAFRSLNTRNGERLWLTESATSLSAQTVDLAMRTIPRSTGLSSMAQDDVATAFGGSGDVLFATRMRAELGPLALDRDLQLQASDRGERPTLYRYGTLRNRPREPLPCGYADYQSCAATPGVRGTPGAMVAVMVFGWVARRRRRRD